MSQIEVRLIFSQEFEGELSTLNTKTAVGSGEGKLRPYDMLLGALGACYYSTFVGIAKKMRLRYSGASIEVRGQKREEVPTTLSVVDLVFTILGAEDQKGFQRAAELAAKHCSIHETISKVAQIRLDIRFD